MPAPTVIAATPISRHQNRVEYSDGRRAIRCSTRQNHWNYRDENGNLYPVETGYEQVVQSVKNNRLEYHRPKNVFSVGVRGDGGAEKFIGLRPDFDQAQGNEQFEISVTEIRLNGAAKPISLAQKTALNAFAADYGDLIVQVTRHGVRPMVKVSDITSFRIVYTLHLKGLTIERKGEEFWVFSTARDKPFRLRIGKPRLLNMNMEVLTDERPLPVPLDFVDHHLIDNRDGSYTYVKESNAKFERSKLPADFLIDADIHYSSTSDGYVWHKHSSFVEARNGGGAGVNTDATRYNQALGVIYYGGEWYIIRSFFYFDTSGVNMAGKRAILNIGGYENSSSHIIAQKGTQGDPAVAGDYDSFEGAPEGKIIADFGAQWSIGAYNTAVINHNSNIVDGVTKIFCREKDHDFDNNQPGAAQTNGVYFADAGGTAADPYIEIENNPYSPQVILVN